MDLKDFPRTLLEFEDRFRTEKDCLAYARGVKWPDGFRCSRCAGQRSYPLENRGREQCATCGRQESVTSGTLFHQTHKSLRTWFRAITLFVTSKRGLSAKELSRQLGIHYETAWTWCHKLRATVGRAFGQEQLSGVVEVDETYLGGTDDRAHQGRSLAGKKVLVGGAVEVRGKKLGRARLEALPDASKETLTDFVVKNVEQHAVARTDGFASYGALVEAGIGHQSITIGKDAARAPRLFPAIHRVFSLFKRGILGTHHGSVSDRHLPSYLAEFIFRFNRRNSDNRWLLFQRVLDAAPLGTPPTMRQLTQHPQPVGGA